MVVRTGAVSRSGDRAARAPGRDAGIAAGSTRRWTAAGAAALVSGAGRARRGRTGATCGPSVRAADTVRWTATSVEPAAASARWTASSAASGASTATGRDSAGSPSSPNDPAAPAVGTSTPLIRPVGAPSRTACDNALVKEGFCQVVSDCAKSADATVCRAGCAIARWIGGSANQPCRSLGAAGTPEAAASP